VRFGPAIREEASGPIGAHVGAGRGWPRLGAWVGIAWAEIGPCEERARMAGIRCKPVLGEGVPGRRVCRCGPQGSGSDMGRAGGQGNRFRRVGLHLG